MAEVWPEISELVELYDIENASRHDHDFHLATAARLGVVDAVDLGCGTGVFAVDLAATGPRVVGVDPAAASLAFARSRPGGDTVEWLLGTAADVPAESTDLVVMMGHVAQYFVDDDGWVATLGEIRRTLRAGGWLTFETRNPALDWGGRWTEERTRARWPHPAGGEFESWVQVVGRQGSTDSYAQTHESHTLLPDGRHLVTEETLRFRSRGEIEATLTSTGFSIESWWGDWDRSPVGDDRPEFIVLAQAG